VILLLKCEPEWISILKSRIQLQDLLFWSWSWNLNLNMLFHAGSHFTCKGTKWSYSEITLDGIFCSSRITRSQDHTVKWYTQGIGVERRITRSQDHTVKWYTQGRSWILDITLQRKFLVQQDHISQDCNVKWYTQLLAIES
jgi:hypothetical protein